MKISLARLTLGAWLAWLLTLAIMAWLSHALILHPSFSYMAIPLAIQVICTVALVGGGIWRLLRGPQRWNAVVWMLIGLLPTLWTAAGVEYLFVFVSVRNHKPNLLVRSAQSAISLFTEPELLIYYPYRYEGDRFVTWSDRPWDNEKQMAAMDAHIHAMEKALGRRSDYKAYWIRGPILGIEGRYGVGWVLGSRSTTLAVEADGLNYLDRHEVAHFVLDQLLPRGSIESPMLLIEGWAEVQSGHHHTTTFDQRQFYLAQQAGELFSLRELTGSEWFSNSDGPVYWQGCILVDYLLHRFGHEKFIELCSTCSEATFPDDAQRVLGLSLDDLDKAYQEDFAQQGSPEKRFLLSAKLADGVDKNQWHSFAEDYCAGAKRFRSQFNQASVTFK